MQNRRSFLKSAAAGASLLALPRCSGPSVRDSAPNVILLVMDTVRADHVSCYGYGRATTPNLDRFASTATRYPRTFATAPWTIPTNKTSSWTC